MQIARVRAIENGRWLLRGQRWGHGCGSPRPVARPVAQFTQGVLVTEYQIMRHHALQCIGRLAVVRNAAGSVCRSRYRMGITGVA